MTSWREQMDRVVAPAIARSTTIRTLLVKPGALDDAASFYSDTHGNQAAYLIADENTWAAAGERLAARLGEAGIAVHTDILPASPRPKPTVELANILQERLGATEAIPVAVGSGVLNDLVKHAAFELKREYSCVATAASMDGYTSAGAPLSRAGFKMTIPCRAPAAILADLDVISAAPTELATWGYGDLAGKVPAGGDWILADALGIEAIDDVAWPLVQDNLRDWLSDPKGVARGETGAIADLFIGLTLSGLAMEFHGSSRPASGADHQIAHLWEMQSLKYEGEVVSHGSCVSIGTLSVLALYDWLMARDFSSADIDRAMAQATPLERKSVKIKDYFGHDEICRRAMAQTAAKHIEADVLRTRLEQFVEVWPQLRERLRTHLLSFKEVKSLMAIAGAPVQSEQIGITPDRLRETVLAARFLRSRYTILDTLDELGLLEEAVDESLGAVCYEEVHNVAS